MPNMAGRFFIGGVILALVGCGQPADQEAATAAGSDASQSDAMEISAAEPVVEIVATEYALEGATEMSSGWNTIRFTNNGNQHHFVVFYRLPAGKSLDDLKAEVIPAYEIVGDAINAGEVDNAGALELLGEVAPEWAFAMEFSGGVGLVAPGAFSETTIFIDTAGEYVIECYVKDPSGQLHSAMGMIRNIAVTETDSSHGPPAADYEVVMRQSGIELNGEPQSGQHTFAVNFAEDPDISYPFNVHLARLESDTNIDDVVYWMDWLNKGGMQAPAPVKFIGGAEYTPAGGVAYFSVNLEPGRYLLVSEVHPNVMQREFSVE